MSLDDVIPYLSGCAPVWQSLLAADEAALSVMEVGDLMSGKGWHLNALMNPPAVHIACTVRAQQPPSVREIWR